MIFMSSHIKGVLALLFSAVVFGSYGIYSRMIGLEFGAFSQSWVRNTLVSLLIFSVMIINWKKFWKSLQKKDIPIFFVWTLGGSVNMVFFFIAANKIQIGTLYFIAYAFIILSGFLFGNLFFKEKLNVVKVISSILAIIGLCLVYTVSIDSNNYLYILFSAIVGITSAFWTSVSKKISPHYSNIQMIGIDSLVSFAVTFGIAMIIREPIPSISFSVSWLGILLNSITQILGVGAVIYGYKHIEVQLASIITPVEVVFAALFGFIIFQETLPLLSLLGGFCILSAALLPHFSFRHHRRIVP